VPGALRFPAPPRVIACVFAKNVMNNKVCRLLRSKYSGRLPESAVRERCVLDDSCKSSKRLYFEHVMLSAAN